MDSHPMRTGEAIEPVADPAVNAEEPVCGSSTRYRLFGTRCPERDASRACLRDDSVVAKLRPVTLRVGASGRWSTEHGTRYSFRTSAVRFSPHFGGCQSTPGFGACRAIHRPAPS